eukprot:1776789-Pyramimonas_sp.AAC.1
MKQAMMAMKGKGKGKGMMDEQLGFRTEGPTGPVQAEDETPVFPMRVTTSQVRGEPTPGLTPS